MAVSQRPRPRRNQAPPLRGIETFFFTQLNRESGALVETRRRPFGGLRHFTEVARIGRRGRVEIRRRPFGGLRHLVILEPRIGSKAETRRRPFGGLRHYTLSNDPGSDHVEIRRRPFG